MAAASSRLRRPGRAHGALTAFGLYGACSFVYFGLTLLLEPGSRWIGPSDDPQFVVWLFAWWPHAIWHGQNPFVTHAVWAPSGVDLVWTTSMPGIALLFAPVTLLAGPIASYNTAMVLTPALDALSGFVLCRHLTRSFWPSLLGGYLFGFSSYLFAQQHGHLHTTSTYLIPLVVLVLLRYVEGTLEGRGLVLRLAPLLALELAFSTELSMTLLLMMAAAWLLGLWLLPRYRSRMASLVAPVAGSYAVAAVLCAPILYFALSDLHRVALNPPQDYSADLLNYALPSPVTWYGRSVIARLAVHYPADLTEQGACLGLPALAIVVLYARGALRAATGRFLLACFALAGFLALGSQLHVGGHVLFSLPWTLVDGLPLFNNILPDRLSLYTALAGAVIAALWMARQPPGRIRWILPALAVAAIVPNFAFQHWSTAYTAPSFFADGIDRSCIAPGEIVLPLPISEHGHALLWQVESHFRFDLAGGKVLGTAPLPFKKPAGVAAVAKGDPVPPAEVSDLRTFISAKRVGAVVVEPAQAAKWEGALNLIARRQAIGGVAYYDVSGAGRRCVRTSAPAA